MPIKTIKARQIFDSRGNPTVEVDLVRTYLYYKSKLKADNPECKIN